GPFIVIRSLRALSRRRLERDHLRALLALPARAAEEVDARTHDLDDASAPAVLLPVAAAQVAVDADPPTLAQVLRTELPLTVPDGDADEVRPGVASATADREQEARHLLVLAYFADLDVACEVADEADSVHGVKVEGYSSRKMH